MQQACHPEPMSLTTCPLDPSTWPDFAHLVEAHHGVCGGCWCTAFHAKGPGWSDSAELNRAGKEALVGQGCAHAALVYDGADCVGWCQFGPPRELRRIKNAAEYRISDLPPVDWRITCFFVGEAHRGKGVAVVALDGALTQIAQLGGGMVEAFPQRIADRNPSGPSLQSGTLGMFLRRGFIPVRPIGEHAWIVIRPVAAFP